MRIPDDYGDFERRLRGNNPIQQFLRRGGRKLLLIAVALILVLIGVLSSYYTVAPEGRAVIKRFGRVVSIRDPGLHFKLPFGVDTAHFVPTERVLKEEFGFQTRAVGRPSTYQRASDPEESLMLTGDLNVINVEWVVQYRIREPEKWLHEVRDQIDAIRDVSESVMRRVVGNRLGSDVLTVGRVSIANETRDEMQRILDEYGLGVQISAVELQDVTPPGPVAPAFNEVNESRQQKERLVNLAEKERNELVPRARGEAQQFVSEAEAYATERINAAKGETSRFAALLTEYQKAQDITRQRLFLEMIDQVLPRIESLYVLDESTSSPLPLLDLGAAGARGARTTPPTEGRSR